MQSGRTEETGSDVIHYKQIHGLIIKALQAPADTYAGADLSPESQAGMADC